MANPICDFINQTADVLVKNQNIVIVFFTNFFQSRKVFLKKITNKKKFEKQNGIFYFYPIDILPFSRFSWVKKINLKISILFLRSYIWLKFYRNPKIIWIFYPHLVFLLDYFKKYKKIYDIIDFYTNPDPKKNNILFIQKKKMLEKSDVTTAISNTLKKQYLKISNQKITIVPQGFKPDKSQKVRFPKLEKLKNIVGYIGAINERLDFDLLIELIKKTPNINYVFVGPIEENPDFSLQNKKKEIKKLLLYKNFIWLDRQPKEKIASIIEYFDVCIIPYDISQEFNRLCYPMKLFEYFYAGKPVVSTPIEELKHFPKLIKIGKNADEWEKYLYGLLQKKWPDKFKNLGKKLAENNSWENKIKKTSSLL